MCAEALSRVPEQCRGQVTALWSELDGPADTSSPRLLGFCRDLITGTADVECDDVGVAECMWSAAASEVESRLSEPGALHTLKLDSPTCFWHLGICGNRPSDGQTMWHLLPPELRSLKHRAHEPNLAICVLESPQRRAAVAFWAVRKIVAGDELCVDLSRGAGTPEARLMRLAPYLNDPRLWADELERDQVARSLSAMVGAESPVIECSAANHKQVFMAWLAAQTAPKQPPEPQPALKVPAVERREVRYA